MKYVMLALAAVVLGGCCSLKKVTIAPKVGSLDPKTGVVQAAEMPITLEFEKCPSAKHQQAVAHLRDGVLHAFDQLVAGEITKDQYNELQEVAVSALKALALANQVESGSALYAARSPEDDAWVSVARAAETIDAKLAAFRSK